MVQLLTDRLPIVDSHLDLAENVTLFGRDLTLKVAQIRAIEKRSTKQATVSLPGLEQGGIAVIIATVTGGFLAKDVTQGSVPSAAFYRTPEEAEAQALKQIELYESWESQGRVRIIKSVIDLEHHLRLWQKDGKPGLVMLMEGADPIVQARDLIRWWERGLRIIGLTYGDTKYGAGVKGGSATFKQGGLTNEGFELIKHMAELGFIWDISHLAEEGIWQGLDLKFPRVCASHANARALAPTDRHLSDDVIRAIAERSGVMGVAFYNGFLEPRWNLDKTLPVTLGEHVWRHITYIGELAGWNHVGIGSDLDGGFGLEESPVEIDTVADLYNVGAVLPLQFREAVLSGNWLDLLRRSLPRSV
jgi:membrane dipeptidase